MPNGSKYGSSIVIVQERQYRPSSTYTSGSSTSRSSTTNSSSSYSSTTMDSSSSSRSSSASHSGPDRTGVYRTGGADGYKATATHNTKGKREVVIVQHHTKHSDPEEPRTSDRYRN